MDGVCKFYRGRQALFRGAEAKSGLPKRPFADTLAMVTPRSFMAVGVPAVSDRISINRPAGRLSGLQIVKAAPSACQ